MKYEIREDRDQFLVVITSCKPDTLGGIRLKSYLKDRRGRIRRFATKELALVAVSKLALTDSGVLTTENRKEINTQI